MVDTRETPTPANTPTNRIGQGEYADAVAAHTRALWGVSILTLQSVTGTDDIVAQVTPAIDTAYSDGMAFWFTPIADNTGPMTLDVGGGAEPFVRQNGDPMEEGDLTEGVTYLVLFAGTEFRIQNNSQQATGDEEVTGANVQTFTSSGTWEKPVTGSLVLIRCWGAGGSGGRAGSGDGGGGGGGGSYVERYMNITDLADSVTVTVGAGGPAVTSDNTNGTAGGNTTFGSHVTAYGGGGGNGNQAAPAGGGGGGMTGAGSTATIGAGDGGTPRPAFIVDPFGTPLSLTFGIITAGAGNSNVAGGGAGGATVAAAGQSMYGGGGGGGGEGASTGVGGNSIYGGGGGGGGSASVAGAAGGTSLLGGAGGAGVIDANVGGSGVQPGGGGGGSESGNSGAGGAGMCIVIVW